MKRRKFLQFRSLDSLVLSAWAITKRAYQQFIMAYQQPKRLVFVIGCQRSGTTMLMNTFRRDFRTKVYGETGFAGKNSRRLRPYNEIAQIIAKDKASLIVTKPLIESQNAVKMLEYFPDSRAVWMYRHYWAVAKSGAKTFNRESTMKNLRAIVYREPDSHWTSERVSESAREIAINNFSEKMSLYDAEALFWYLRNRLFFDLELDAHPHVFLCQYEDVVTRPARVMKNLYQFLGCNYPGNHIVQHIHNRSVNSGTQTELSEAIENLCIQLQQQMDQLYLSALAESETAAAL